MKVIRSSGAGKKTKRIRCTGCRATFEVEGKDLTFRADARDGAAYTFACPECKKVNWLDDSFVPPAMKAAARR